MLDDPRTRALRGTSSNARRFFLTWLTRRSCILACKFCIFEFYRTSAWPFVCCPVLMSASANNCAHSATTIGAANASGITSKHQAWGPSLRDLPYEFYALAHEPGRISDTALSLLDRLISRLPTNDRPRLRTYAHQLLAATTALGVARVIRAGLPIRCDSSNRVLPTPGDAIPSNGLPPRPPPGQFRSRSPDRTTPFLATNHPANTPDSPESPRFILRESPPDQPVAVEEAPAFEGAAG